MRTTYVMELRGVDDPAKIRRLMRPRVLERSRAADNAPARYRRTYFMIRRIRRTKRYALVVEVLARDIAQAARRAGRLLRPSVRDAWEWKYRAAYGGFSLAGRK